MSKAFNAMWESPLHRACNKLRKETLMHNSCKLRTGKPW